MTPVVLVILKAPRPGTVKTRLAADLGAEKAARIYRRLVERQMAALPAAWPVEVHFAPRDAGTEMRAWLGPRPQYFPQAEGDLGVRVHTAIDSACTRGAPAVLVIGGDCPELDSATLHAAASGLSEENVVLGPATDGGYYLIGLRRAEPGLFANIPWSTSAVFTETLSRARALGLPVTQLPALSDVDTLDDLRAHPDLLTGLDKSTS